MKSIWESRLHTFYTGKHFFIQNIFSIFLCQTSEAEILKSFYIKYEGGALVRFVQKAEQLCKLYSVLV